MSFEFPFYCIGSPQCDYIKLFSFLYVSPVWYRYQPLVLSLALQVKRKKIKKKKRPWCCERLRAGGEGDDREWDGWMASPTQWTWVWVDSGSCWWTGRPGVLRVMGLQRVRHDWATELNWIKNTVIYVVFQIYYLTLHCFDTPAFIIWKILSHFNSFHLLLPYIMMCECTLEKRKKGLGKGPVEAICLHIAWDLARIFISSKKWCTHIL